MSDAEAPTGSQPEVDVESLPPIQPAVSMTYNRYLLLVAAGAFATTFPQQGGAMLGHLPSYFLLDRVHHISAQQIAEFMLWATMAWNIKPLAGILTDAIPLFGTRRRHYMIFGATLAAVCWILMAKYSQNYTLFLAFSILMNVFMVLSSTVMGGLMVEAGQAYSASGRVSSVRQAIQNAAGLGAPVLGGYLSKVWFGWAAGVAATCLLGLAVLTYAVLHERPVQRVTLEETNERYGVGRPRYSLPIWLGALLLIIPIVAIYLLLPSSKVYKLASVARGLLAPVIVFWIIIAMVKMRTRNPVLHRAQYQLVDIFRSRTLWMACGMLFLVYMVPSLNITLTNQQNKVLHFKEEYIGLMDTIAYGFGILSALFYFAFCRKLPLRTLIIGGVGTSALSTLLFLPSIYTHDTAPYVHGVNGLLSFVAEMALMDLAVRSTPEGCEALGFALMMSVRNFGIAMSNVLGTKMMGDFGVSFGNLVIFNAVTTAVVLVFVPMLPRAVINRREGEATA